MIKFALGVVMLLALLSEASAGGFIKDGNVLLALCTSGNLIDQTKCIGYIEGTADLMNELSWFFNRPQCVPNQTVSTQAVDVVLIYLRDHPVERSYTASSDVVTALSLAWKCSR
jgi:hypothetical protein